MAYEKLLANFSAPPEVSVRPVNANGVSALVVAQEPDDPPTLLHLHGGGYIVGSAFGYRPLAGALALAADAGVLVPDYRLAPEHTFPAAIDDAVSAYRWMLDRGVEPEQVRISRRLRGRRSDDVGAAHAQAARPAATRRGDPDVPLGRPRAHVFAPTRPFAAAPPPTSAAIPPMTRWPVRWGPTSPGCHRS